MNPKIGTVLAVIMVFFGILAAVLATYCLCTSHYEYAAQSYVCALVDFASAAVTYITSRPL